MTPIWRQYLQVKKRYPHALLLFRMGDFYETFDEDARIAARELEITLTTKPLGKNLKVPLAGIPHHALENYLAKLLRKGYRVAICEQLTDPATSRGLVERDVVRVVTPGTVLEPVLLEGGANNYLAAVALGDKEAGLAYVDITTSEFRTTQLSAPRLEAELERLHPAEILVPRSAPSLEPPAPATPVDDSWFDHQRAQEALMEHFGVASVDGYGCGHLPLAVAAAGAILRYLQENQKGALPQLTSLATYSTEAFMTLDTTTRRNLELFRPWEGQGPSLLSVLDLTKTAMGARLLKRWLGQPLLNLATLERRQEAVDYLHHGGLARARLISILGRVADVERLVNRARAASITPREVTALRRSLESLPDLRECLPEAADKESHPLDWIIETLPPLPELVYVIQRGLVDDPPATLGEGGVIRDGFSPELDEVRAASKNARHYLAQLEGEERQRTGIKTLKVGYNRVFGYYIEVGQAHSRLIPPDYIRKQTLMGAERYFTTQLKEYESLILNAQEKMEELEATLFRQVCQQIAAQGEPLLRIAHALAELDVLATFAEVAIRYRYVRPQLTDGDVIQIQNGRHPVVERSLAEPFIPNDTYLNKHEAQLIVLTGPNMSGKSTYLRQVALIVLMAQTGSFVPATAATIGLVDRIFTRVGAQDDLARGRSTFMVEMLETANILNHATPRSLIILDEIGRGTSTYDGLSIAQAVTEYIHNHPRLGAKTIFATHYHEMVELARYLPRVRNFNVAVAEEGAKVIFLRKIVPGGADRSYGIHVAQLAGLPRGVISRAQEVLKELEGGKRNPGARRARQKDAGQQISLLENSSPLIEEMASLDVDSLTPLEAITKLYELKRKAKEHEDRYHPSFG
ncbi:MAG: DNA mismatch repair protein MutS [Chloroflexi bacterium]|nr:DNA mismatch repair protein MutS [Chloroflexota bacterium]